MARILVRLKDNNRARHPNLDMAYRSGDIIAIEEDRFVFGRKEVPPNFSIIDLSGITASRLQQYVQPKTQTITENIDETWEKPILRRQYKIDDLLMNLTDRTSYREGVVLLTERGTLESLVEKDRGTSEWDDGKRNF